MLIYVARQSDRSEITILDKHRLIRVSHVIFRFVPYGMKSPGQAIENRVNVGSVLVTLCARLDGGWSLTNWFL
jgi:hypothetical protein